MIKATFCELDSHADTCCFGNECQVLYEIGKADVTGFHQDLGQVKGPNIVTAAAAYDNQENGNTYLLIFNQVLFLPGPDHHLINPFQLRDNRIVVNDNPLIHTNIEDQTTSTHSITVPSVNLQIPLQLNGVLSGLKVRKPTNKEINDLYSDAITMTADSPEWYPMDPRYQVEGKEMCKDLNEDLNCNPRDRRIQLIQLHYKTFESVKSDLRNMWSEGIQELENACMRCTDDDENNNEIDGIEVIDLCSVSRCGNDTISERKETTMQESQDKSKHEEINKKVAELKTVRAESTTKKDNVESVMMCWESTESLAEKEHHEEPEKMANKLVETTEKQKHEEEHVEPTLNTGNRLKILIEEFSWEREGDGSTLGTEEPEQQEVVYITNLEDGLRKDGTALYDEKGPNEKSLLRETGLLKCPP